MDAVKDILTRFGFWIALGVWILALLVVRILYVGGINAENKEIRNDLDARRDDMDKFAKQGNEIKNEKWIAWEKKNKERIGEETEKTKDFFRNRDNGIEKLFPEVNQQNPDWAIWLEVYGRKTKELADKVKAGGVELLQEDKSFTFIDWKGEVPEEWKARIVQKQFWLQENLVDIILQKSLNISHLVKIEMAMKKEDEGASKSTAGGMMGAMGMGAVGADVEGDVGGEEGQGSAEESNKVGGMYTPMPLKLEVIMKFETVNNLMHELLKSPWSIEIGGVSIVRVTEGDEFKLRDLRQVGGVQRTTRARRRVDEEGEAERGKLENAVWLTLECEARDFDLGERKGEKPEETQPEGLPANNVEG